MLIRISDRLSGDEKLAPGVRVCNHGGLGDLRDRRSGVSRDSVVYRWISIRTRGTRGSGRGIASRVGETSRTIPGLERVLRPIFEPVDAI